MELFASLWLPIVLSAVLAFIASSIVHMALPLHRGDFRKMPAEKSILAAMRENGIRPGTYMFPYAAALKDYNSPDMIEKFKEGPVGLMTISPRNKPGMGKELFLWFLFQLFVSVIVAYIAALALGRGEEYRVVFRVTSATAFLAYVTPALYESVWKSQRWGITVKFIIDALVYALLIAGIFGWLWPGV